MLGFGIFYGSEDPKAVRESSTPVFENQDPQPFGVFVERARFFAESFEPDNFAELLVCPPRGNAFHDRIEELLGCAKSLDLRKLENLGT